MRKVCPPQPKLTHRSIKFVIIMAQIFGLMPVNGVISNNPSYLRFTYRSFKFVYSTLFLIGSIAVALIGINHSLAEGWAFGDLSKDFTFKHYLICKNHL